jgi:hypothetical protein
MTYEQYKNDPAAQKQQIAQSRARSGATGPVTNITPPGGVPYGNGPNGNVTNITPAGSAAYGGGAAGQAAALAMPSPPSTSASITATQNPNIAQLQGEYQTYLNELGKNADIYNTQSLQAQRDVNTGMENEATSDAARRGFSADTGVSAGQRSKAAYEGAKNLATLGATNAANARNLKAGVLSGASALAGTGANYILGQEGQALNQANSAQNFALDTAKFQQDTTNFYAQLQALQNQNQFNNSLNAIKLFSGGL